MKSDASAPGGYMKSELGAVVVDETGWFDRRIGNLALSQPPEGVANERAATLELRLVVDVLELAPTALVCGIVRTPRLDPKGRGFNEPRRPGPNEPFVLTRLSQVDQVTRRCA